MNLDMLQRKAKTVGKLLGKELNVESLRRKYRVIGVRYGVNGGFYEDPLLGATYLPAKDLFNRLDMVETAMRLFLDPTQSDRHREAVLATGFLGDHPVTIQEQS